ncbi:hypothetical protein [Spiroplasma endosymbiont of Othius punctulatus]|uniref:hypothetical protein n=1 Tax=Spiroplasma endosymbiont of Othius punctulatus TaxID=3066289 RepID=UPI0030D03B06
MKKLLKLLTVTIMTTIPVIGVVSCGTGTTGIINDKINVSMSITMEEPVVIAEPISEETAIDYGDALSKVFEQAKVEKKIPSDLRMSQVVTSDEFFERVTNAPDYSHTGYAVYTVISEEDSKYFGAINIKFKLIETDTVGEEEVEIPGQGPGEGNAGGDPTQESMTDLTRFYVSSDKVDKDELDKFKLELIKTAKEKFQTSTDPNDVDYPDSFFELHDNFEMKVITKTIEENTANQKVEFSLTTKEAFWDEGSKTYFLGNFKIVFYNAIVNKHVIDVNFDYKHPPTTKEYEEDVFEAIKESVKDTDTILNEGGVSKNFSDYYDFDWKDSELIPKDFGDKKIIPNNSYGHSKSDMNETVFGRSENDIIISGDLEIEPIDLSLLNQVDEEIIEPAPGKFIMNEIIDVNGKTAGPEIINIEKQIWDFLVKEANQSIAEKYSGYSKWPAIERKHFDTESQPDKWIKIIEETIRTMELGSSKTITFTSMVDVNNEQRLFKNGMSVIVTFRNNPTYIYTEVEPIMLSKQATEEELFNTFKLQIEKHIGKELGSMNTDALVKDEELHELASAVSESIKTGEWVEYSQEFPMGGPVQPIAVVTHGVLKVTDTPNVNTYELDFKDVQDFMYFVQATPEEIDVSIKKVTNRIFDEIKSKLIEQNIQSEIEGTSMLIQDWGTINGSAKKTLQKIISDKLKPMNGGNGTSVDITESLTSLVEHSAFKGVIKLTNLNISILKI